MTDLNFKELLQAEIDKTQGYVNTKKEVIGVAEFNLLKDKNQLLDLEIKLKELLEKKKDLEEFEEWKNNKAKKGLKATDTVTGDSLEIKDNGDMALTSKNKPISSNKVEAKKE